MNQKNGIRRYRKRYLIEVFERRSEYTENKIIEDYLSYLSLSYEITGNEITVMVYGSENHPYYKMDLQRKEISLIGSVPAGEI